MSLTPAEIKELLEMIEASGWDEAHITVGDSTISVSKGGALGTTAPRPAAPPSAVEPAAVAAAPAAASSPTTQPAEARDDLHPVSAPSVGVFWRAPEPGAPPFVQIGDQVDAGTNLCIVEVMKLMNYVTADVAGVVRAIHVENGAPVEHGTVLFGIEPLRS